VAAFPKTRLASRSGASIVITSSAVTFTFAAAVGLPQSRTVEGIADRARIRKVRLLFARDDVARQRLPPALAQFVILLGQDQFADRQ